MSRQSEISEFNDYCERKSEDYDKDYKNPEWLRYHYHELGKSLSGVAEEVDVGPVTISNWMNKHGIETRSGGGQVSNPKLKNEEYLRKLHNDKYRTPSEIAEELDVASNTVTRWLQRHGIKLRSAEENASLTQLSDDADVERFMDAEWMRQQYVEEQLTCKEIGDKIGVSPQSVRRRLNRIDVELRSNAEAQEIAQLQNPDSPHTDEEWLREQYVEKGLTQHEIAKGLPVSAGAINHWLQKLDIETRSRAESMADGDIGPLQSPDWLREEYREKKRTVHEIGDELGVSHSTVLAYLERHGIQTYSHSEMTADGDIEPLKSEDWLRQQYWEEGRSVAEIADELGISSSPVRTWMRKHGIDTRGNYKPVKGETLRKLEDAEWLREQYWSKGLSLDEIAEDLDVNGNTVGRWMDDHGIEKRDTSHSILLKSQPENHNPEEVTDLLQDEEWLREQYIEKGRSTHQIGDELDVRGGTVGRWMEKHGIERRSNRVANSIRQSDADLSQLRDADWLREKYWDEKMSTYEIAEEVGTTDNTVCSWMDRHGIEVRAADLAYSMGLSDGDISDLRDEKWLRENYVEKKRSTSEIAEEFGVSTNVVRRWLRKNDIETRSLSEATQGINTEERTKQLRDKDWLLTEYSVRCRSAPEIAQQLGVAPTTVFYYLEKHDIEVRSSHQDPDHLDHVVRSTWELALSNTLVDVGVDYSYESLKIEYGKDRIYIPDFVTDRFVIEVKGRLFEDGSEVEKAEAALDALEERQYVVVGAELPADIHIEWENRAKLVEVLER